MNKVFCPICNKKVNYNITTEVINEYKGYKVNVKQNIAICDNCGERIYVSELENENLKNLYQKYREMSGIISPEEIVKFRQDYGISQRELVAILDWGKMTINRYERGSLPNQSHSEILKLIINNESYFRKKVEDAYKSGRITERTYTEILTSVGKELNTTQEFGIETLIKSTLSHNPSIYNGFRKFDLERLENLIGYIASRVNNLYKTSLNKYLWYIDFSNYKNNLKSITGLRYARFTYGPIIEGKNYGLILYLDNKFEKEIKEINYNEIVKIKSKNNYDLSLFSKDEIKVIDEVIELLKNKTVTKISDLSHEERAWIETKDNELISYEYAHTLKAI